LFIVIIIKLPNPYFPSSIFHLFTLFVSSYEMSLPGMGTLVLSHVKMDRHVRIK